MKKSRLAQQFLAELEMNPNVAVACKRVGLSRQTVYRWRQADLAFLKKMNQAMYLGTESILDLAESKLASNIASGNQRAIETALVYYGKRSDRNKPKEDNRPNSQYKTLADLMLAANQAKARKIQ